MNASTTTPATPINLYADFDSTLTLHDTLSALAGASPTHSHVWPAIAQAYLEDLARHNASYRPTAPDRTTLEQELAYLNGLRPVERRSIHRIEAARLFRDVTPAVIRSAAQEAIKGSKSAVRLRNGWADLFQRARCSGGDVGVVSVNWSKRYIRELLLADLELSAAGEGSEHDVRSQVQNMVVCANEIEPPTGQLSRCFAGEDGDDEGSGIWTAEDKLRAFNGLRQSRCRGLTVYVGDSGTDLQCLLAADVGILVRDVPMNSSQRGFADTLSRLDIEVRAVEEYTEHSRREGRLWWTEALGKIIDSPLLAAMS
ncbi:MAG: hypothetical protein M1833_005856 [Piccolia ochrophora]|nr:MAG: hypothetical protein M1833_005856 [Piccolia ochrophora]